MPPEQARGEAVDARADVYSLGAVLYHLLSGTPPFEAKSSHEILRAVVAGELPAIESRAPRAPKDLIAIVHKAMAPNPKDRYTNASGITEDLKKFQTGQLVDAYQYTTREKLLRWARRYRALLLVIAAASMLISLIGGVSLWSVFDAKEKELAAQKREAQTEAEKRRLADERTKELEAQSREQAIALVKSELEKNPENALRLIERLPNEIPASTKQIWRDDAHSRGVPVQIATLSPIEAIALRFSQDGTFFIQQREQSIKQITPSGKITQELQSNTIFFNISPTGKYISSTTTKNQLLLWEIATNTITTILTHQSPLTVTAFSSDEASVLTHTASGDELFIHSILQNKTTKLNLYNNKIISARFSPNAETIVAGGNNGSLFIWKVDNCVKVEICEPSKIVKNKEESIRNVRFINKNQVIFSTRRGILKRYNLETNKLEEISNRVVETSMIELSPNGDLLAVSTAEGIYLWDLSTKESQLLPGLQRTSNMLTFSSDGRLLAAAQSRNEVWLWSLDSKQAWSLRGHRGNGVACAFSPDGTSLVSVGSDGRVLRWDVAPLIGRALLQGGIVELSATPNAIATSNEEGELSLWRGDCFSGPCARAWSLVIDGETDELRLSPSTQFIAKIDQDGAVTIAETSQGAPRVITSGAINLDFSPNKDLLAIATANNAVELWDLPSQQHETLPHTSPVTDVAFSPDGDTLASVNKAGELWLWDLSTKTLISRTTHEAPLAVIEWSPDGETLAIADRHFGVWLLSIEPGSLQIKEKLPLGERRDAAIRAFAFSPHKQLLEITLAQRAMLWDLSAHEARVLSPMWNGSWLGETLIYVDLGGVVRAALR